MQVYFTSRYRGLCVGTLVSRMAVLTAAVCVTNPAAAVRDTRPINVVTGTMYRHPRRGIRVQVTKILVPNCKYTIERKKLVLTNKSGLLTTFCPFSFLAFDAASKLVSDDKILNETRLKRNIPCASKIPFL